MPIKHLRPFKMVKHITEITPEFLKDKAISTVLLDLDNTLTRWNCNEIDKEIFNWIKELKKVGIKPCIVSNNNRTRIEKVAEILDIPFIYRAAKPRKSSYKKALAIMQASAENTAFVGDQLFTDVLGANRMRLYSILVNPLHPREFVGTKVMRRVERLVMRHIKPRE